MREKIVNVLMLSAEYLVTKLVSAYDILEEYKKFNVNYSFNSGDIFIISFPKSGTTLLQMILYQIYSDGNMNFSHIHNVCPYLELVDDSEDLSSEFTSTRIISSHESYKKVPHSKAKYVYIMRDPRDTLVSLFHHSKNLGYSGTFKEMLNNYFSGNYQGGLWADHVSQWLENKKKLSIHFIKYEELILNKEKEIKSLLKFLNVSESSELLNRIIEKSSFSFMKIHQDKFDQVNKLKQMGQDTKDMISNNFLRVGKSGEGKNHFDKDSVKLLQNEFDFYLKNKEIDSYRPD